MSKMLVFDMDGTFVDLYGVPNWLEDLRSFNVRPYVVALPMYNMNELVSLLLEVKALGYLVAVTSWLAKETDEAYKRAIRQAKRAYLDTYKFPYDEVHFVQYGTPKASCTRGKAEYQILFDDNAEVRDRWTLGPAIDASTVNIVEFLRGLLQQEGR